MLFCVGSIPDKDLFGCARMKQAAYKIFLGWHNSEVLRCKRDMLDYDVNAAIYAYCRSDVLLLNHGVLNWSLVNSSLCFHHNRPDMSIVTRENFHDAPKRPMQR